MSLLLVCFTLVFLATPWTPKASAADSDSVSVNTPVLISADGRLALVEGSYTCGAYYIGSFTLSIDVLQGAYG